MSTNVFKCTTKTFVFQRKLSRRRCFIAGWSLRSAWRTPRGPSGCPLQARESPAPPATPATTTATTPPVYPAHLEPTLTAPTVKPRAPVLGGFIMFPRHQCFLYRFVLRHFQTFNVMVGKLRIVQRIIITNNNLVLLELKNSRKRNKS